jgi:cellulose synthase/poly-beta-1,6-N-acetylglucosamine synthase-like glycosyltransferase
MEVVAPNLSHVELPIVSLLIIAHNEEDVIEERIRNTLAMDYPRDRLEIVIALDGCTDGTSSIVQRYRSQGVRLLEFPRRRGKSTTLNDAFEHLQGELVVLSDANTEIEPTAVRRLLRWFGDPKVGVVCGRLVLKDPINTRNVDSMYWKYETFIKRCEGRLGALLGANGAIYAIRRELYKAVPGQTLIDDFVIPLQAKLRSGCSIIYEASAIATEVTPEDVRSEFRRRARIGTGGFQSIGVLWRLLDPRKGWVALSFFSHKFLRWLCPFFMIGALVSNFLLLHSPFYRFILMGQLGFYLVSALAGFLPPKIKVLRPLRLATMFSSMNLALFMGFWYWILGSHNGVWVRTSRVAAQQRVGAELVVKAEPSTFDLSRTL